MELQILVFNCGSSSIKFALLQADSGMRTVSGLIERLGSEQVQLNWQHGADKISHELGACDYTQALQQLFLQFAQHGIDMQGIAAVAHRVVHGGDLFAETVQINDENLRQLRQLSNLAPLHNPANLAGIDYLRQCLPDTPQFMTFDTGFHATLSPAAFLYPIPYDYYKNNQVRKYGFHGTSHQFVAEQACKFLNLNTQQHGIVTAHLGNGCSLCAIDSGKSVDTTMGFTPLDGVMMGTRSGSIDPSIHAYLCEQLGCSIQELTNTLNKNSGLMGISGRSNDMRDLEQAMQDGDVQASLAIEMFILSISKHLHAMCASLPRLDAVVFTGGIGENSSLVRARVVQRAVNLGLSINPDYNQQRSAERVVRLNTDMPAVLAIKTDEEWQMAREACLQLTAQPKR